QIAYSAAWVGQQRHVFVKTLHGAEQTRLIYTGKRHLHLTSWSPDGRWIAFAEYSPRSTDVWLLDLRDSTPLVPVATTPAAEAQGSAAWSEPVPLFEIAQAQDFAVSRDGRSIYFVAPNPSSAAHEINVAVNWLQDLLATPRK